MNTKDEKLTNFDGMRLVFNPSTLEFYLFAERDKAGLIYGKLDFNTTQIKYHVKRGDKSDGRLTGYIHVENMPFELTYYQPRPEMLLINKIPEVKVNEVKYERFHPELYESGVERNPPKGLNSKAKKKWHKECTQYLQSKIIKKEIEKAEEIKPVEEVKEEKVNVEETGTIVPPIQNNETEVVKEEKDLPPVVEAALAGTQVKKPVHGQGNKECYMGDYPDGFIIAHIDPKDNVIIILGTPNYPDSGLQRFLVFCNQKQASYAFKKLTENAFYAKQLVDGLRQFVVLPVSNINEGNRNIPTLAIHDVYKFLESPLMKVVKNG